MTEKCPTGKIWRKPYTKKDGTRVKGTCIPDKGKPGKTPEDEAWSKDIDIKKGALGAYGWAKDAPEKVRHAGLENCVEDEGYGVAIKRLQYLINLSDDTKTVEVATNDRNWLQKKYRGQKRKRFDAGVKGLMKPDILIPAAIILGSLIIITMIKRNEHSTADGLRYGGGWCTKCKRKHRWSSKIGKEHHKFRMKF
jgi:hypothetical protein